MVGKLLGASRWLALAVAVVGTVGSLVFSLGFGWEPCDLCWYQRICLYPLVVILGVSIWRKTKDVEYFVLPLSLLGAGIALYQYLLQKTSWFGTPICQSAVPCTVTYIDWWGVVTIPLLAFVAFMLIGGLVLAEGLREEPEVEKERETSD